MKKIVFLFLISVSVFAQTGIGTTTPNASAKLDVYSTNKGFLPPRVTLTSTTDASTIASPAEGLLVYNLGSVGLQAGYYYWNGANWATIATATSAGNGVTSIDLVKLYSKGYSFATGDIAHANGFSFTVPISGRYLFDFSSTGFSNATITYKVRQGTTDIGTDGQTSTNNTVHVEYNGKIEVNLQSGVSYNVYVNSTGNRDAGDYDRVYYKLVAGNLPVTGQSVDYIQASLSANQTLSAAGNVIFNTSSGAGITITSGGFELKANKTYKLEAAMGGSSSGYAYYTWVDNLNSKLPGASIGVTMQAGDAHTDAPQDKAVVFYTPTVNTTVFLRVLNVSGSVTAYAPPVANNYSSTWATIQQVGSSAFVNPWTLSGTNTFNTTGNVGIGTNSPTAKLNISGGGVRIASGMGNTASRPSINTNTIGNYEIRGVGGGNPQIDLQDDGFLRLSAGGGTNAFQQSSIDLSGYSATVPDMNSNIVMRTAGAERLRLDNSGNVNVTGKLNVSDAGGGVAVKAAGFVDAGTFVTLDNLMATVTTSGNRGLSLATVTGTLNLYVQGVFTNASGYPGTSYTNTPIAYTTTASGSLFGWGFGEAGNTAIYHLTDAANNRLYRITLIIQPSFLKNFISIERLL